MLVKPPVKLKRDSLPPRKKATTATTRILSPKLIRNLSSMDIDLKSRRERAKPGINNTNKNPATATTISASIVDLGMTSHYIKVTII